MKPCTPTWQSSCYFLNAGTYHFRFLPRCPAKDKRTAVLFRFAPVDTWIGCKYNLSSHFQVLKV